MLANPVTGRKYKRSTVHNAAITSAGVVVLLLVIIGGKFAVQHISKKTEKETQNVLREVSVKVATAVIDSIGLIQKQLDTLAEDESVKALFIEADSVALESEGEQKMTVFDSALKLRLLLPGQYGIDKEAKPPLSFASVNLLERAEKADDNIVVEVHSFSGDDIHIALVSRVLDTDSNLLGLLLLSVPLSVIEPAISTFDFAGTYIEIRQGAIVLGNVGHAKFRKGLPSFVGIDGTKWTALSWNESSLGIE